MNRSKVTDTQFDTEDRIFESQLTRSVQKMNIQLGKTSIVIVCGATAVLAIVYWVKQRKTKQTKPEVKSSVNGELICEPIETTSDDRVESVPAKTIKNDTLQQILPKEWRKIGHVNELFIYPLKSGRGKYLKESVFTDYGISVNIDNRYFSLRDRMFLVYNEETGEFRTSRNYPTLILVTLSAVDTDNVKLEAVGMPSVMFKVPESTVKSVSTPAPCLLWWGGTLECLDCGSEVAKWISKFLTGTNNGLRLGCATGRRNIDSAEQEPWENFDDVYATLKNTSTGLSSDLGSYMVMSESSVHELNQKMDRPGLALQFRPNIVIAGPEPFAEDNWDWIKIGEGVVIRNVKPYSSFRGQRNPQRVQVEGKAPTMGIYCGIYQTGNVQVGDDVYINQPSSEKYVKTNRSVRSEDQGYESQHFLDQEAIMNNHNFGNNGLS
ncbi:mitochondrial amidoxime-reducing component 1 [Neodiprion lecontei]|uniref:Mitochondrial amidoxime-reducing component 1 n=1 Tax=Neodiprion lecontei TaxID=441921 RepID=A0A6J0BJK1_NEOLC|nr:mitochondrial amidoxime-reducing component 1 [Neodiprion lecontei]